MKKLLYAFLLFVVMSCGNRKAEMQRQINIYKSELSEQKKINTETDSNIEKIQTNYNSLVEKTIFNRTEFEQQLAELGKNVEKMATENKEDLRIQNAIGNVKITDSKGNQYEIPSGAGTSIEKNSADKSNKELQEVKEAYHNEMRGTESLQQDLSIAQKKESTYRETIKKQASEISDLTQKVSDLNKTKDKKSESKRSSFAWYVLAFVLGMASLQLIKTQFPILMNRLSNKR